MSASAEPVVRIRDLTVAFGARPVLRDLSLDLRRGEILALVGGSGSGKSVLMRSVFGLIPKQNGGIEVLGVDLESAPEEVQHAIQRRWGILYQHGALFSSLTLLQNIQFPMREYLNVSDRLMTEVAVAKLEMVGLSPEDSAKLPSELSGGMTKRAALARALALDPEVLFLDEPTTGLDPISAAEFDTLIRTLQKTLGLTVLMVTHDLDTLRSASDRIAALADGRIVAEGSMADMLASEHPWVKAYFQGVRARAEPIAVTE